MSSYFSEIRFLMIYGIAIQENLQHLNDSMYRVSKTWFKTGSAQNDSLWYTEFCYQLEFTSADMKACACACSQGKNFSLTITKPDYVSPDYANLFIT